MTVAGVLLAAGAGRRMGGPKALVGSWLTDAVTRLRVGGCEPIVVVLGAGADQARARLAEQDVEIVVAKDWAEGMGASLRAGLAALVSGVAALESADAALVMLVDLPDVGVDVVQRVLDRAVDAGTLARAAYAGVPGHPVLLGRDHWAGVVETARGDPGARAYLTPREVTLVECGDLATGRDVDSPPAT